MDNSGKFNILRSNIYACNYDWIIKEIIRNKNKKKIIAPVASHPIVLAYFDRKYKKTLEKIDFLLPDSQYVRWAIKCLYGIKLKDRIYGPELFLKFCKKIENDKFNVFLIGNNLNKLTLKFRKLFPDLKIRGFVDLNYKNITNNIIKDVNKQVKRAEPDFLFIGIGSPNQHNLAVKINKYIPIICVGAAFDFVSGNKPQAPKFFQNFRLEWLYRLANEPKRLWKRYLIYGPIFVLLVILQKIKFILAHRK